MSRAGNQSWPTLKEVGKTLPPAKPTTPKILPRQAALPQAKATSALIGSTPSRLPASPSTPVFFQCPVCRGTLMIRNPQSYDGSPGPCTSCHAIITAPAAVKAAPTEQ